MADSKKRKRESGQESPLQSAANTKPTLTNFPLFASLPAEIRIKIWNFYIEDRKGAGRMVKISPILWDSDLRCRYVRRPRGKSNKIRVYCISHENMTSPIPATEEASFEARQIVLSHLRPMQLGQRATATPTMVRYDIDTILLLNHCLSLKAQTHNILTTTGFGRDITSSPDWQMIQHLAMEWTKFHTPAAINGRQTVFTKEILKMKSLKTFTLIATYVRFALQGPQDSLTDMRKIRRDAKKAGTLGAMPKGLEKACMDARIRIETDWNLSVMQVIHEAGLIARADLNIPRLRVKTLKMNRGQTVGDWRCAELR